MINQVNENIFTRTANKLSTFAKSIGGLASNKLKGSAELQKLVNSLFSQYRKFLGKTSQKQTLESLQNFLIQEIRFNKNFINDEFNQIIQKNISKNNDQEIDFDDKETSQKKSNNEKNKEKSNEEKKSFEYYKDFFDNQNLSPLDKENLATYLVINRDKR